VLGRVGDRCFSPACRCHRPVRKGQAEPSPLLSVAVYTDSRSGGPEHQSIVTRESASTRRVNRHHGGGDLAGATGIRNPGVGPDAFALSRLNDSSVSPKGFFEVATSWREAAAVCCSPRHAR